MFGHHIVESPGNQIRSAPDIIPNAQLRQGFVPVLYQFTVFFAFYGISYIHTVKSNGRYQCRIEFFAVRRCIEYRVIGKKRQFAIGVFGGDFVGNFANQLNVACTEIPAADHIALGRNGFHTAFTFAESAGIVDSQSDSLQAGIIVVDFHIGVFAFIVGEFSNDIFCQHIDQFRFGETRLPEGMLFGGGQNALAIVDGIDFRHGLAVFFHRQQFCKVVPDPDTRIVRAKTAAPVVKRRIVFIRTGSQIAGKVLRFTHDRLPGDFDSRIFRDMIAQFTGEQPPQAHIFFQKVINSVFQAVFATAGNQYGVFIGEGKTEFFNIAVFGRIDLQLDDRPVNRTAFDGNFSLTAGFDILDKCLCPFGISCFVDRYDNGAFALIVFNDHKFFCCQRCTAPYRAKHCQHQQFFVKTFHFSPFYLIVFILILSNHILPGAARRLSRDIFRNAALAGASLKKAILWNLPSRTAG